MDFVNDFLRGQQDCKNGEPHKPGQGDYYDRGYKSEQQVLKPKNLPRFNIFEVTA